MWNDYSPFFIAAATQKHARSELMWMQVFKLTKNAVVARCESFVSALLTCYPTHASTTSHESATHVCHTHLASDVLLNEQVLSLVVEDNMDFLCPRSTDVRA